MTKRKCTYYAIINYTIHIKDSAFECTRKKMINVIENQLTFILIQNNITSPFQAKYTRITNTKWYTYPIHNGDYYLFSIEEKS